MVARASACGATSFHRGGPGLCGAAILVAAAAGSSHRANEFAVYDEGNAAFHRNRPGEAKNPETFSAAGHSILKRFRGPPEERSGLRFSVRSLVFFF